MLLTNEFVLPSDDLSWKTGLDGCEPGEIAKAMKDFNLSMRVTLAINTGYPEVRGGHYFNRRILALVQRSLEVFGLWPVFQDLICRQRTDLVVPTELLGSLDFRQEYLLVDGSKNIKGFLFIWDAGGAVEAFYHDKTIIDIIVNNDVVKPFKDDLHNRCKASSVFFRDCDVQS